MAEREKIREVSRIVYIYSFLFKIINQNIYRLLAKHKIIK